MRTDLNTNLASVSRRTPLGDCAPRRLDEIEARLDKAERSEPFTPVKIFQPACAGLPTG